MNLSLYLLLAEPAETAKPIRKTQPDKPQISLKRQFARQPIRQPILQPIYQGTLRAQSDGVRRIQASRIDEKDRRSVAGTASSLAFGLSVAGNAMAFIVMTAGVLLLLQIAQISLA